MVRFNSRGKEKHGLIPLKKSFPKPALSHLGGHYIQIGRLLSLHVLLNQITGKPDPSVELKVESETKAEEVADSLILSPLSLASRSPSPSSSSSSPSSSPPVKVVTPETQAERAARVCDIVHEK